MKSLNLNQTDFGSLKSVSQFLEKNKLLLSEKDVVFKSQNYQNRIKVFDDLKFVPAFIIRTLYDGYINQEKKLSHFQRNLLNAWKKNGLSRKQAFEQISKFSLYGANNLSYIDEDYFKINTEKLDIKLRDDIKKANFKGHFNNKKISAARLKDASTNNLETNLTSTEKEYLERYRDFSSLSTKNSKKYPPILFDNNNIRYNISSYTLKSVFNKYRLDTNYDGAKGDVEPVFFINGFYTVDSQLKKLPTITIQLDEEDVIISKWVTFNWRIANAMPIFHGNMEFIPQNNPTIVVSAMEDDEWFSDDTRKDMDFALDVAQIVGFIDPSGIVSTVVGLVSLAWDTVCFLDDLDENDIFTPKAWCLDENKIADLPEDYDKFFLNPQFILREVGGRNVWRLEITSVVDNIRRITSS